MHLVNIRECCEAAHVHLVFVRVCCVAACMHLMSVRACVHLVYTREYSAAACARLIYVRECCATACAHIGYVSECCAAACAHLVYVREPFLLTDKPVTNNPIWSYAALKWELVFPSRSGHPTVLARFPNLPSHPGPWAGAGPVADFQVDWRKKTLHQQNPV